MDTHFGGSIMPRLSSARRALPAWALLALALVTPACDHEKTTCPGACQGRIAGRVLGGGSPVAARVHAYAWTNGAASVAAGTHTDSEGRYELSVPTGRFYVEVTTDDGWINIYRSASGITLDRDQVDSVDVQTEPVELDFSGGSLSIDLGTPAILEGTSLWCHLGGAWDDPEDIEDAAGGHAVFRFPLLPPGDYIARISDYPTQVWLPHGGRDSADTFTIEVGRETSYAGRLSAPARILGSVRGSWQAMGVAAPGVSLFVAEGEQVAAVGVGNAGEFALDFFGFGPVRLLVSAEGSPDRWVGGVDFAHATVFDIDSAGTISGVSIVESGILATLDGPPADQTRGCWVSLWDGDGRTLLAREHSTSNPLRICNLDPGAYHLRVAPYGANSDWFPQFYDGADSLAEATPIVITTEGEVVPVTLHPVMGGRIAGRVLYADGTPVPWAEIFFSPVADSSQIAGAGATGGSAPIGVFTIHRLHTGAYKIGARLDAAPITWYPSVADWDSAGAIEVVEGSETVGMEWRLRE
jgi:hypothetical protein